MFECATNRGGGFDEVDTLVAFARNGGKSLASTIDAGVVTQLFGIEVSYLHDELVHDLAQTVRDRIQKMKSSQKYTKRNMRRQRMEITCFLRLVLGSTITVQGSMMDATITILRNSMPKLIDPLLRFGWQSVYEKEYEGYEFYHGVLEWRWLVVLLASNVPREKTGHSPSVTPANTLHKLKENNTFFSLYCDLMLDVLELAFQQFRMTTVEDIGGSSPFHCSCVKLIWLGLMSLAEESDGEIDFWKCLCENFTMVVYHGKYNFLLFKIWMIKSLGQFNDQKVSVDGTKQPLATFSHNHAVLDCLVKELVRMEYKEEEVRAFLILLKPIICGWWPVRYEAVLLLWDYFCVRLNSPFQLKGESLESLTCSGRSMLGFIQQAKTLALPESTLDDLDFRTNSFRMFLIILASIIRHYTENSTKKKVQIIFNRIFIKLGPKKYENMTDQAIYNLSLALLTMINSTSYHDDYPRISKLVQMVPLIEGPSYLPVDSIIERMVMITHAHMTVMVVMSESVFDKTTHLRVFLSKIEEVYRKFGQRLQPVLSAIAEGATLLLEKSVSRGSEDHGESSLIGPWIVKYLLGTSDKTWNTLLDAILRFMSSRNISAVVSAVEEHVLPFVKKQFMRPEPTPACISGIAAHLTILSESSSFLPLFDTFVNCPTAHLDQLLAYLIDIIKSNRMVDLDKKTIIRQWLKLCFFYDQEKLKELSRAVHGLDEFKELCEIPEYDLFESEAVPIKLFFRFVGIRFSEADGTMKLQIQKNLHIIFEHFDKWVRNPRGIIRRRILSVLALALRECNQAFYIIGVANCHRQKQPCLQISPESSVHQKAVGSALVLTCHPDVPDTNLISDLKWSDNRNMTILRKSRLHPTQQLIYTETIAGGTGLALIFSEIQESMAGAYYCTGLYSSTEKLNAGVMVETYVAITWKDAPQDQRPLLGTDYIVRCEVTANPPATVDWLRNGDRIKSGGRYVIENRGLLIRNITEEDDGAYTCRAAVMSTGELSNREIRVEVQIMPHVQRLPSVMETAEGESFSIMCNATGRPEPEFQWIKKSQQQNVANLDRFSVNATTGQLDISVVGHQDHDSYTCIARNPAGQSETVTKLNVLMRPRVIEFMNITVSQNTDSVFACKAFGRPAPEITYRRYGSLEEYSIGMQMNDDRIVVDQSRDDEKGETIGTLRIAGSSTTDDGLYECIARNPSGVAYKIGHLTVEYGPIFDYMETLTPVYTWEERPANLSCFARAIPNATIVWYWKIGRLYDLADINMRIDDHGPRSDLIITPRDRRYYTVYTCVARNKLGSDGHVMELREARRPDMVPQAKARVVRATSITFDIKAPSAEPGLPLTAFSVQWKEEYQNDWNLASNRTWSPDSLYIVEGLRPQTAYSFRFAARNVVGLGQWSAYADQSTPKRSEPEMPRILHTPILDLEDGTDAIVMSPFTDHCDMQWTTPVDNGEPIDMYRARYCPGTKVNGIWTELEEHCVTQEVMRMNNFEMRNLQPNTNYRVELMAHNAYGFSQSAHVFIKTAREESDNSIGFGGYSSASKFSLQNNMPKDVTLLLLPVYFVHSRSFTVQFN